MINDVTRKQGGNISRNGTGKNTLFRGAQGYVQKKDKMEQEQKLAGVWVGGAIARENKQEVFSFWGT